MNNFPLMLVGLVAFAATVATYPYVLAKGNLLTRGTVIRASLLFIGSWIWIVVMLAVTTLINIGQVEQLSHEVFALIYIASLLFIAPASAAYNIRCLRMIDRIRRIV